MRAIDSSKNQPNRLRFDRDRDSEVWWGPPKPVVDFHTGPRPPRRRFRQREDAHRDVWSVVVTALSGGSERRAVRQQFKARDLRVRQAQAGAGRLLSDRGLPDVLLPRRRHLLQDEQPAGGLRDGLGLQGHGGQGRDGVRAGRERDLRAALVPRRLGRGACGAPPGAAAPARTMTRRRGSPRPARAGATRRGPLGSSLTDRGVEVPSDCCLASPSLQ